MKKIELLAPVGNFESLVAAVQNRADAVYLGGKSFGARAFAGNFEDEDLIKVIHYAHIRNVKVYITVNTLIFDNEIDNFLNYINFLYMNDVDALILQDVGMASIIHQLFPNFELHASTQTTIANAEDALFYKSLGFKRLVLARENSMQEINHIKKLSGLEIESFVHGALCVSYSGKCLFSQVTTGRSANRGECAQPCRYKYSVNFNNGKQVQNYFLSTKDLCSLSGLKEIIDHGTDSLKIEGRMKRYEYVATVVKSYREAIDAIYSGKKINESKLIENMASVFNREFTKGFILNEEAKDIINSKTPNNIGVHLGTVENIDQKKKRIHLHLDTNLNVGDGTSLGEHVGRIILNDKTVERAEKGNHIQLDFIGRAKPGDKVRKTSDIKILEEAKQSQRKELIKNPLDFTLSLKINKHPSIKAKDDKGNFVEFIDDSILIEEAKNNPISPKMIVEQISKLESKPYYSRQVNIEMDESVFLRVSTLNHLRRNIINLLDQKRGTFNSHTRIDKASNIHEFSKRVAFSKKNDPSDLQRQNLSVFCRTEEQINACSNYQGISIYVDDKELYFYAIKKGFETFYATPTILKDSQIEDLNKFIHVYRPNLLTTSIGYAKQVANYYKANDEVRKIRLDYMANLANHLSYKLIDDLGFIDSGTLSIEVSRNLSETTEFYPIHKLELPLLLHPLLMVCEYCPSKLNTPCSQCSVDKASLSSNANSNVIIRKDSYCRMLLIDKNLWDNSSTMDEAKKYGIYKFRIDLLDEDQKETELYIKKIIGRRYE